MTTNLADYEKHEIERANASGLRPVVFVHGLWLLPSSWKRWRDLFEQHGYTTLAPGWPDDPQTVEAARAHPEVFAGKSLAAITDHYVTAISGLKRRPIVIGHSFGGLVTQMIAGGGHADASVAIDPAPFRGVLPLPFSSLKTAAPVLTNPANRDRAKGLTFEQFKYGWANELDDKEAHALYEEFHVPGAGRPLFQAAFANVYPGTEDKVDTMNPNRGPMLLISGERDHTVPWAVVHAAYERQLRNPNPTDIATMPNRGHALVIDHGWSEVATVALEFLRERVG